MVLTGWPSPAALAEDSLLPNSWSWFWEPGGSLPKQSGTVYGFLSAGLTSNSAAHLSQRQTHRQTHKQTDAEAHTHTHAGHWHGQSQRCHKQGSAFNRSSSTMTVHMQHAHKHTTITAAPDTSVNPPDIPGQLVQLEVCQRTFKHTAQSPSSQHMAHGLCPVVPLHPPAQSSSHTGAATSCVLGSAPFPFHGWRLKMPTHPHWWDHALSHSWHHRLGAPVLSDCVWHQIPLTYTGLTSSWNSAIALHKYTHDREWDCTERFKTV